MVGQQPVTGPVKDDPTKLTPQLLLQAYRIGVFPMSESRDDPQIFWVDPRKRGIMPLDGFHISRSLARFMRRADFSVSCNRAFTQVVEGCADRSETWINDTIFDLYQALHDEGQAHSVEVWAGNRLIGGLYGVAIGAAFFGESMFSRQTNASKIAITYVVDLLRQQGFTLFDTQFVTPHLASLGGVELPRKYYHAVLAKALMKPVRFQPDHPIATVQEVIQRNAQMS